MTEDRPEESDYFLPFPDQCPYNGFCDVKKGIEAQSEDGEAHLCGDLNYTSCPAYATQYRSDLMNCFANGVAGAMLRHLREGGLEVVMNADEEGIHEVVVRGFNDERES